MSAPSNVYLAETLPLTKGATVNILYLALKLTAYGPNIKNLFYVDIFLTPDNGDKKGYIGAIENNPNALNYKQHDPSRFSKVRLKNPINNKVYILLNDGGLNTRGRATINNNILLWANNVRNNYTFLSAYYVNTDFTGVRFRVGLGAWTEVSFFTTMPQQQSLTTNKDFDSGLAKGTLIEMQGVIKNAEHDSYSDSLSLVLQSNIFQMDAFKRSAACTTSGQTTVSLWITQDTLDLFSTIPENTGAATGVYLYTDIEQVTKASTGWYFGLDDAKSFFVDATGQITHYITCVITPGTIYLSLEQDGEGFLNPVFASVDPIYPSQDIIITGRVDVQPSGATPDGKDFTITILAGEISGQMDDFNLPYSGSENYYWQNVSATPAGFTIVTQDI